ncbi:MAG: Stp1/IreP family PP2C-type Ser/Thr phosphatase [Clostridiaceae bacterium]
MAEKWTDIGNSRDTNEDFVDYDIQKDYGFYIVCDGIGGHKAGEIASKEAVELIKNYIREFFNRAIAPQILESAIQKANHEILRMSHENQNFNGMGTTITCALDVGTEVYLAHAGDSSAYLIKADRIAKLTRDHSLVQEMVDLGTLKAEDMVHHPNKNIITRSLGTNNDLKLDVLEIDKDQFDFMMLCTDGLTDYVTKEEMLEAHLIEPDKKKLVEMMVNLAKARGSKDNISLLIFGGDRK